MAELNKLILEFAKLQKAYAKADELLTHCCKIKEQKIGDIHDLRNDLHDMSAEIREIAESCLFVNIEICNLMTETWGELQSANNKKEKIKSVHRKNN